MRRRTLAIVAALAAFAGSCAAAGATTYNVTVGLSGAMSFSPSSITIIQGDTIHWVWGSDFHSTTSGTCSGATCTSSGLWDSGVHNTGYTFDHTFNSTGVFPYYCSVHGTMGMVASVTVNAPVAVTVRSLTAARTRRGYVVRWRIEASVGTLGFNVFREWNGRRTKANRSLLPLHARHSYSFVDRRAARRTVPPRYWIQAVALDGTRSWYGPATVARP